MKIAMISEHANPLALLGGVDAGGQNVYVASLSQALAARGHAVTVYTRRDDPAALTRVALGDGVDVVHLAAGPPGPLPKDALLPHMPAFAAELAAAWAFDPPAVVHSHFWMSGLAALDAVARLNAGAVRPPVLHTFHALGSVKRRHQGVADTSPAERARLEPSVGQRADAILATCRDEVRELRALGVPEHKVRVIPCGVDPQLFNDHGPSEARNARFRIVSVGRLVPRKGVDLVIRSLAVLRERGIADFELEVVGAGDSDGPFDPEVARLRAIAADYGVQDRVHFRGAVPQQRIPAIIRSADAVVCTPWYEPFGIVPLESMACGVPVIAAAVGGLSDSVLHGITGLHVPPHDPVAIADAVMHLLIDPALRRGLGRAGRTRVLADYTWPGVAAQVERSYLRALRHAAHAAALLAEEAS